MTRLPALFVATLLLNACFVSDTLPFGDRDVFSIDTVPSGATVRVAGHGECETPCTIRIVERQQVTVAKAGYRAERFTLGPGDDRRLVIELRLAAPTGEVDEQALPEL